MAKKRKKLKNKKSNKKNKTIILLLAGLVLVAATIIEHKLLVHGVVDEKLSDTAALVEIKNSHGGDKYSLDLSVARQAVYYSSPLTVTRTLPKVSGIVPKEVSFRSEGLKEYALMTLPNTPPPIKGYPVVILLHGYVQPENFNTDGASYLGDMLFYNSHGYAVVRPDLRGNGKSEGIPEGAYYSMAYNVDIMSLISSIGQTANLNKNDLTLWGHSMGGYLALRAAVLSPVIKKVIILSGAVGTPQDMYSMYTAPSDALNPIAHKIRQATLAKYGSPSQNPEFWNKASPLNYLNKTSAEFQIHVGDEDRVVPPEFAEDLNRALNAASVRHEYFIYPGGNHGLGPERNLIYSRSLIDYFPE